ncbi:hypothetical protein LPJ61_003199 [Coemansia biformis]|uniref:Peregrin n=1 Tax=Coemansia biformis TaxID=1286918 RepID=A0A9W8CYV2_9FUNG|nr:hypothetical protein LPJ61_003199 [Coemansia biformis]
MGPMASRTIESVDSDSDNSKEESIVPARRSRRSLAGTSAEQGTGTESDEPVERGRRALVQRLRANADGTVDVRRAHRRRTRLSLANGNGGDSLGYASSPTESRRLRRGHADSVHVSQQLRTTGPADEHGSSGPETVSDRVRRRVLPLLVTGGGSETEGTATPVVQSPPPIIDKPREERSYKEFFPDLNVHMPLTVLAVGGELVSAGTVGGTVTPVSSGSECPPSTLSVQPLLSQRSFSLDYPPCVGKGAQSYAGTPQSSVVVLAPKRPVVALPEAKFRRVARERRAKFSRPSGHYIHNMELTEKDLAERVEYDLDEVDLRWLEALNAERAGRGATEVSAKQLETIVDHMEKEWFDLVKDAQKAISALQQERLAAEESTCAICGEDECDNTNAIVFCDGCNMAVHQDCYGVPYIPEGQWLCRRCMLSPAKDVTCVLCPQRGGAFKKTTGNKWAHVLCALWIPEVGIANSVYMEPIDGVDQIPRSRWRLYCHLCHRRAGACIQCSHRQCVIAFHATCARRANLAMSVRADRRSGEPVFRAYCERHTPAGYAQEIDVEAPLRRAEVRRRPAAVDGVGEQTAPALVASADAEVRALVAQAAAGDEDASLWLTMRTFNPDWPVLNEYVVARVAGQIAGRLGGLQQRIQLAAMVARYWALKRRERHGAPLLKRLHLEPWTASVTEQRAQEVADDQCQGVVRRIRTDLERVRLLVESVRRREREKLRRVRLQVEYLRRIVAPLVDALLPVMDELIEQRDPRGVLGRPVSEEEAPDYRDVITEPMDLGTVRRKLLDGAYGTVDAFERDLGLVVNNCLRYNKPATYFYRLGSRIKSHIARLMVDARRRIAELPINPATGCLAIPVNPEIFMLNATIPTPPSPICAEPADDSEGIAAAAPSSESAPVSAASSDGVQEKLPVTPVREDKSTGARAEEPGRPLTRSRGASNAQKPATAPVQRRRLTLFEQLSLPPPDVRRTMRDRFALTHPEGAVAPNSDIPDDINVLKSRLRAASTTPAASPAAKRVRAAAATTGAGIGEEGTPGKRRKEMWTIPTAARLGEDPQNYPPGTLVWAKMESYPWFPAETCDPAGNDVPEGVSDGVGRAPEDTTLVRFFAATPAARQWRWVSAKQICRLGTDPAVDCDFFRARKSKSSNMVRSVRMAYVQACDSRDIKPLAP